jgi:DNA polymerase-3 subunit delta
MGEEELLRARAVGAVRTAVLGRHPDTEVHELAAAGLPIGQLADVLAPWWSAACRRPPARCRTR